MSKVKFNVNTEYAYIQNFKVLQNCFQRHQIDRTVPVELLVKCKMQDNLEFLQWTKRYWDQYFPGGEYDALARRKGSGAPAAPPPTSSSSHAPSSRTSSSGPVVRRGATPTSNPSSRLNRPGVGGPNVAVMQQEISTLKETVTGLERERDFYFLKLRDIELLLQQAVEADPEIEKEEGGLVKQIQNILYSTEEGFEIPAEVEAEAQDDLETF
ncbi:MAG: Microtubule-associated protein RP/EB member 1 [Peltula sp. TS41687]|nr:MAG: Microtubule-associated protein RP/EB member 1 [Peltula sp. TS41687]